MAKPVSIKGRQELTRVVSSVDLAPEHPDHFKLTINSPWIAANAVAGQFVHVLPPSGSEMLRRPFSIMSADPESGDVTFLYRVIGGGTSLMASLHDGDTLDCIGPLGNGFPVDIERPAILAGGGVGIPPLVFLAKTFIDAGFTNEKLKVFLGARDEATLVCMDEIHELGLDQVLATEDGSAGLRGLITDAMTQSEQYDPDSIVYSCGPIPMLAAIAKWSSDRTLTCYVSLENKLGCGIGACLGCSIPIREPDESVHYERVCCDGPAFDASRVAFDLM